MAKRARKEMKHLGLERDGVLLGPVTEKDLPALFEWINTREDVLFNAPFKPIDSISHREWFDGVRKRKDLVLFAIRTEAGLVGTCQLHSISPVHRSAELQIRLGEKIERGRGVGTSAVSMLVEHGFRDLNLQRIMVHVFATNAAAIRTYEKCGFEREGVLRRAAHLDGKYVDIAIMSVLRDD